MNKNKKTIEILAAFSLLALINAADASPTEDVVSAATKLDNAMLTHDIVTLESLTAESLTYGHSSGKIQTKKEFIQELATNRTVFNKLSTTHQEVYITDNTAIIRSHFSGEVIKAGKALPTEIENFQVWIKNNGKWQLVGRQAFKP
ncbi:nuclear transport factor 2 family protein [Pantoea sp. Tr-811]|uniref:nuclear transport factor 2 family protein n=1 Tax=Pantoea sp. Tr-811 TaxID=2608361 RepID=UPI0014203E92|nr:nuclear transport factor 2 family protein [Pantoea sp. Tr-811]